MPSFVQSEVDNKRCLCRLPLADHLYTSCETWHKDIEANVPHCVHLRVKEYFCVHDVLSCNSTQIQHGNLVKISLGSEDLKRFQQALSNLQVGCLCQLEIWCAT